MTVSKPVGVVVPLVPLVGVDDVGLVRDDVSAGTPIQTTEGVVAASDDIPAAHKVAVRAIAAGMPVRKYGEVIGVALCDIPPGAHVPKTVSPAVVHTLPPKLHDAYTRAIAASLHPVFVTAAVLSVFAFALTWLLREVPLRTTSRATQARDIAGASSEETAVVQ